MLRGGVKMHTNFSVSLKKIINEFSLEVIFLPKDADQIFISTADVNRPGLQLAGFFEYFDVSRLEIIGKSELEFLCGLDNRVDKSLEKMALEYIGIKAPEG